jgi:hypothetical protein
VRSADRGFKTASAAGLTLSSKTLIPNHNLRKLIQVEHKAASLWADYGQPKAGWLNTRKKQISGPIQLPIIEPCTHLGLVSFEPHNISMPVECTHPRDRCQEQVQAAGSQVPQDSLEMELEAMMSNMEPTAEAPPEGRSRVNAQSRWQGRFSQGAQEECLLGFNLGPKGHKRSSHIPTKGCSCQVYLM